MPKGDAKEGYLNTNAHLEMRVAMLERALAESQAREQKLREALAEAHDCSLDDDHRAGRSIATTALALPQDDSALREMIAAEREACAKVCDNRYMFMGDDADRAVEGCAAAIRYRNVESC